jgi:hypothetical protein
LFSSNPDVQPKKEMKRGPVLMKSSSFKYSPSESLSYGSS